MPRQFTHLKAGLAACLLTGAGSARADVPANVATNGGFEGGNSGWMWEQWSKKPFPGTIENTGALEGKAYFRMGMPDGTGGRYFAKEIPLPETSKDYLFSFALKKENLPEGAARVRLGIPDRGFFKGGDLVREGGSGEWETYKFALPAASLGAAKKVTVFFYHDQIASGYLGIDALSLVPGTLQAGQGSPLPAGGVTAKGPALTGATSRPDTSTFKLGEKVTADFTLADLKTSAEPLNLQITVVDEHGDRVDNQTLPVQPNEKGSWTGKVDLPAGKVGFYRVNAKLSNGISLQAEGSRAAGFLTYAVLPDPARRKDYGESGSRFGMQGGFGPWRDQVLSLLGARWVLDGSLEWRRTEPQRAGQFQFTPVRGDVEPPAWQTYTLPTLFAAPNWAVKPETLAYMTGSLTPEGEKAWDAYCRQAARAYMARNPSRKENVYQITWEPIRSWGFKGTDSDLVRIYEIAYKAIHETDPKAVVAGPTRGINNNDPQKQIALFKLGLGKYLDAYTTHPYHNVNPERDGMVRDARAVKTVLTNFGKGGIPMMGTEQGISTEEDPSKDLEQARALIRQNLITLGEGYQFNMAFYIADYRLSGQKGYGYYYTLDGNVPFGPKRISPRPIVPAYAAQSLLLDGSHSAGAIEWLGGTSWGYAFERDGAATLALWDYGAKREVTLPVGVDSVQQYDWMGNSRQVNTPGGTLSLPLGPEPVYITGASSKIWGRSAEKVLTTSKAEISAYPGSAVSLNGGALLSGPALKAEVEMSADTRLRVAMGSKPLVLGSAKRSAFSFLLTVPQDTCPGTYPVRFTLKDGAGRTLSATGVSLNVISPVRIQRVLPRFGPDEAAGMGLQLTDQRGEGVNGSVELRLKEVLPGALRSDLPMIDLLDDPGKAKDVAGSARKVPFQLRPGATDSVRIFWPSLALEPRAVYQAVTTVTTESGYRFTQTSPVNFLVAKANTPQVDGDLREWKQVPIKLAGKAALIRAVGQYSGEDDLQAKLRFSWDSQALYIAAEVEDDKFHQPFAGGDTWRGDCLQLSFDLDARQEVPDDSRRHTELNVALTPEGPQVYRSLTFDTAKLPGELISIADLPRVIRREGHVLVYELAIPWKQLGSNSAPLPGFLGFGATVNDADGPEDKEPAALGLYGGIHPDKEPSKLGILVLGTAR